MVFASQALASMLVLDMKGELAAISQDQTADRKHCIYWNPAGLHDLPQMSINPVDYVRIDSASLISDVKVLCQDLKKRQITPRTETIGVAPKKDRGVNRTVI